MQNFPQYTTYRSLLAKKQGKGFSEVEVKDILQQVLSQLVRLHDRQLVHGLISLDTVVYDSSRMKIMLLTGSGVNKPIYLAPEILQTQQLTPTADIYAIAIVAIILLTGLSSEARKAPNNKWNWEEQCFISDQFTQILNIALSAARDSRYVNADQMLCALQTIIDISVVAIPPDISALPLSPFTPEEIDNLQADLSHFNTIEPYLTHSDDLIINQNILINKISLPNSTAYRRTKSDEEAYKIKNKSRIRILMVLLVGMGLTAGGLVAGYFYTQSKYVTPNSTQNTQFYNTAIGSVNSAITRLYQAKDTDDNINKLLALAKDKYENAGDLTEAKKILLAIPSNSPIRPKADKLLAQWNADLKKNDQVIQKAEKAFKDGNWQLAINTVKSISKTPHWQLRGKKIAENAKQQLSKKVATPPPVVAAPVEPPVVAPTTVFEAPFQREQPAFVQESAAPYTPPPYQEAPPERLEPAPSREAPPPPRMAN